jgi:uncharacterized protein YozE (UPF0346 family)
MTFYTYMTRMHLTDDTPMGDLARDMKGDGDHFPRNKITRLNRWHEKILNYLYDCGACSGCLDAFEEAWEEYTTWMKNR